MFLSFFIMMKSIKQKRAVIVTNSSISAPISGISKKTVLIQYQDITNIEVQKNQGQQYLNISHPDGTLIIPQIMLPNKKSFELLVEQVTKHNTRLAKLNSI
ncbi:MAG: hypothetical protein ACI86H_002400 [bacterium]|jgi:hypothetical protein